ncbi:NAD-dependent epimerase/dehydratase family protein [Kineosporia babensis]|uniref:NAD-dependent epimerase/dehydratase family protein n=1 Tax=Kineosporia babensis TaxID=499548 RepID=A0A9X1NCF7_9ACTN|nr:NAD-dependent epimerase/dehydratase family protein [Kineosporia babensis]
MDRAVVIPGPSRAELDLATADQAALDALVREAAPDVVVNATGQIGGSAEELERGNVAVTRGLLAAAPVGVRFVQLGSLAEYGAPAAGCWSEDAVAQPLSDYGRAKLRASNLVLDAGTVDGCVLRVANPVGAGQPAASLVGSVLSQLLSGSEVRLGSLAARRDIVSAQDVGRAIALAALTAGPLRHRVLNVGTGRSSALRDVVDEVLRLAGGGALIEGEQAGSARSAAVADAVPSVQRAADVLGWVAQDSMETAVRQAVDGAGLLQ